MTGIRCVKKNAGHAVFTVWSGTVIPLAKGGIPGFCKEGTSGTSQAALLPLDVFQSKFWTEMLFIISG